VDGGGPSKASTVRDLGCEIARKDYRPSKLYPGARKNGRGCLGGGSVLRKSRRAIGPRRQTREDRKTTGSQRNREQLAIAIPLLLAAARRWLTRCCVLRRGGSPPRFSLVRAWRARARGGGDRRDTERDMTPRCGMIFRSLTHAQQT
jgi:hypothetical protein